MYKKRSGFYNKARPISGWSNLKPKTSTHFNDFVKSADYRVNRLKRYLFNNAQKISVDERRCIKLLIENPYLIDKLGSTSDEEMWLKYIIYGKYANEH